MTKRDQLGPSPEDPVDGQSEDRGWQARAAHRTTPDTRASSITGDCWRSPTCKLQAPSTARSNPRRLKGSKHTLLATGLDSPGRSCRTQRSSGRPQPITKPNQRATTATRARQTNKEQPKNSSAQAAGRIAVPYTPSTLPTTSRV